MSICVLSSLLLGQNALMQLLMELGMEDCEIKDTDINFLSLFFPQGATKEIGSALTRIKSSCTAGEYKKARAEIKKKSSDTIKLQKKVKKGKDEVRMQLDSALQDVNTRYAVLEETEKRAVCRALIEERGRFCSFVTMLKPVLTILEDLGNLTADPNSLPPASEQVILDLKGSDYSYSYQTPPASPSNTLSRKSSISSNYTSVRHVPSLDSISSAVDGLHLRAPDATQRSRSPLLLVGGEEGTRSLSEGNSPTIPRTGHRGQHLRHRSTEKGQISPGTENGTSMPPLHKAYSGHEERARALSTSGKPQSAREQLALTLGGGLNSEAPRTSRDSLHCSSGYSTQTTTPSCSEDTIPSQHAVKKEPPLYDYDYISLHGGEDTISQSEFDKSSTIPRNSDLSLNYRKMFQSKRPASTASVSTAGLSGSDETMCPPGVMQSNRVPSSDLVHTRHNLCTSTQSLSAMPPPYYSMFPGQPPVGGTEPLYQMSKQQQYALHQQQQRQYQQQLQQQYNQQQYNQQHYNHQQQYNQAQEPQYQQINQKELQQKLERQQHQNQNQQLAAHNSGVANESGQISSSQPAVDHVDGVADPGSGGDMLSMIRRGVRLRRTLTNDRSAPLITPNHLN
ncbi:Protein MTSS 2 [Labeo rohita]|uniref:Protein MTSS 2 n=1 Tax=Labeo rohita TaxID=84645 RepID=A0ABQ8MLY1_LABRO|nr:Protein MTSS 2 [Labeo rohita]